MFLMFGLRKELSWAVTSDTNGMKGDEYIYHLASEQGFVGFAGPSVSGRKKRISLRVVQKLLSAPGG
jgi:hypothetical protein